MLQEASRLAEQTEADLTRISPLDLAFDYTLRSITQSAGQRFRALADQWHSVVPPAAAGAFHTVTAAWLEKTAGYWSAELATPLSQRSIRWFEIWQAERLVFDDLEAQFATLAAGGSLELPDIPAPAWGGETLSHYMDSLRNAIPVVQTISTLSLSLRDQVRASDWYQDGIDDRDRTLLAFLSDANRNTTANPNRPALQLPGVVSSRLAFDAERLIDAIDSEAFAFVPLKAREVVVVATTGDSAAGPARRQRALGMVAALLPQVEAMLGDVAYPYQYLHLQIDIDAESSHSVGPNVYLLPRHLTPGTLSHELVHVYQGGYPTWFVEGLADLVAVRITGDRNSGYIAAANGEPIQANARITSSAQNDVRNREAGNGYLLLGALLDLAGQEPFRSGIAEVLRHPTMTGSDILATLLMHTPEELQPRVEALFRVRVANYTPAVPAE